MFKWLDMFTTGSILGAGFGQKNASESEKKKKASDSQMSPSMSGVKKCKH